MYKWIGHLLLMGSMVLTISCTSHSVISPEPLKKGESYQGVALTAENIVPQFVVRKGLNDRMDVGLRVGMFAFKGSGLDMTMLLRDEGKRLHTLNFGGSYAEQSSYEATYYNIARKERSKTERRDGKVYKQTENNVFNYGYIGLRYAYIPTGFWGDNVHLFGLLYGLNYKKNWGAEIGYFHDFTGRTADSEFGFNPKYAPLTGISLRVWFGQFSEK